MGAACRNRLLDDGVDDLLLVREVIGDDALADTDALGDLVDRRLGEPQFSDRVDRTVDDQRPARRLGE